MRRLQQKWCSIAVSSALVAMVGAAHAAPVDTAAVAKSDSPALKAFASTGRLPYIVGFRDVPAVTYEAQLKQAPTPRCAARWPSTSRPRWPLTPRSSKGASALPKPA